MNHPVEAITCPNCNNPKTGKFCSNCGQKEDHRYDLHMLWHDLVHAVTHADKGIFSYGLNVLYRPGYIARDLVEGRRKRYFNSFQFLLIMLGVYALVLSSTNFMGRMMGELAANGAPQLPAEIEMANTFMNKYQKFVYLLLVPVSTYVTKLIFPKSGYNYAEHMVGYVVYYCNSMMTHTILVLVAMLFPANAVGLMMTMSSVITLVMMVLYFRQFYGVSWLQAVWKMILYMLIFIVVVAILTVVIAYAGMRVKS